MGTGVAFREQRGWVASEGESGRGSGSQGLIGHGGGVGLIPVPWDAIGGSESGENMVLHDHMIIPRAVFWSDVHLP